MRRQTVAAVVSAMLAVGLAHAQTPPSADLSITITDYAVSYTPGGTTTYTIVVANAGPDAVTSAVVSDVLTTSPQIASATWTCVGTGGAICTPGPVAGGITDSITLPVGATATYTLVAVLSGAATGNLINTASITPPSGTTDPGPGVNSRTDTDAPAGLLYVATTGIDSISCGASTAPCKTIQAAINRARAGDTVVVQAGTYKECIVLTPGIGVGGVRVESDEHLAARTNAATFLDGEDLCGAGGTVPGPVVMLPDGSSIVGFTIENGGTSGVKGLGSVAIVDNAIVSNTTASAGGGIYVSTGTALTNAFGRVLIQANAIRSNTSGGDGSGVFVDASASGIPSLVEIRDNIISGNTALAVTGASGGGIAVYTDTAAATDSSVVVIRNNTLDGNGRKATGEVTIANGGGLLVRTAAVHGAGIETVTIGDASRGNYARNNFAYGFGGGMSIELQAGASGSAGTQTVTVSTNRVSANTSTLGGGGAHVSVRAIDRSAGVRVSDNIFTGNHAQGTILDPNAAGGGGIYAELHAGRTVASCEIDGNTIEGNDASPHGGGASLLASADDDPLGNGATGPTAALISFHNNLVVENAAHDVTVAGVSGGGVYARAEAWGALSHVELLQDFLTVAKNETEIGSGGLEWEERPPPPPPRATGTSLFRLSNSIVWSNDGYGVGGTILPDGDTTVTVAYADTFGSGTANYEAQLGVIVDGTVNISQDPALDAFYLPRLCGPTIDRGDPAILPTNEPLPDGGRVNLGHVGHTASGTRTFPLVNGDTSIDRTIDGLDLIAIAASFGAATPSPRYFNPADVDKNGLVDGLDLSYVAMFYAQSCPE